MDITVVEVAEKVAPTLLGVVIGRAVVWLFSSKQPTSNQAAHASFTRASVDAPVEHRNPLDTLAFLLVKVCVAIFLALIPVIGIIYWLQREGVSEQWIQRIAVVSFIVLCAGAMKVFLSQRVD